MSVIDYCFSVHCHCGNQGPQSDQKVIDTDCNTECIGDRSALCGGEDRIQIYDLMSNWLHLVQWVLHKYVSQHIVLELVDYSGNLSIHD